jgi:ribosomal protein S27AE
MTRLHVEYWIRRNYNVQNQETYCSESGVSRNLRNVLACSAGTVLANVSRWYCRSCSLHRVKVQLLRVLRITEFGATDDKVDMKTMFSICYSVTLQERHSRREWNMNHALLL